MMYQRHSKDRGYAEFGGWLKSHHTFSFSDYHDPRFMGFRDLRVINQDWIAKDSGFPAHPHRDMEIITYVLQGEVAHQDSLGNLGTIKAGEIQVMHAGTGIRHGEFNPSKTEDLQLFQIWVLPNKVGVAPGYTQASFTREEKLNKLRLLVSNDGRDGSQKIHQDVDMYACILEPGHMIGFDIRPERALWLQVAEGDLKVNDQVMKSGDGLAIEEEHHIKIEAFAESEFLLFDLR